MEGHNRNLRVALAVVWLILTSSLALWWMIFAMQLISKLDVESERHRTMLFGEGATLLGLLLIGGSTLIYFILQESRQSRKLKLFFSGFTHDVKTRLAGVKLQTEVLRTENTDKKHSTLIDRLLTDTSRLQVQVENSLFVGGSETNSLHFENFKLGALFEILRESWPQIQIRLEGDASVRADRRAFENVCTNILHNAISHGQASEVQIKIEKLGSGRVRLTFQDNGQGFQGEVSKLGEIFYRHNPSSGSGLGLYTARESVGKMRGDLKFLADDKGFGVVIELEGGAA